jgi:hypothetical protein
MPGIDPDTCGVPAEHTPVRFVSERPIGLAGYSQGRNSRLAVQT